MIPLERAARVLARRSCPPGGEAQFPYVSAAEWEEKNWREHIPAARAVIAAIREPSEGMIEAGKIVATDPYAESAWDASNCWEEMIDALLEEG